MRLWKLLFDHDPNGLLVLDEQLQVKLVNVAMCRMLKSDSDQLIGQPAAAFLGDVSDFRRAFDQRLDSVGIEHAYPQYDLYVRQVIFAVPDEDIVAGIFVDMTREWKQRREILRLKQEALQQVRQVVDKQMNVAQEIAGLLGETTAETKVSLLRLLDMLQRENV